VHGVSVALVPKAVTLGAHGTGFRIFIEGDQPLPLRFDRLWGVRIRAVGCTHAEIGAITGHKNAEVTAILERHYAATDPVLARTAIAKLEGRTKSPNCSPNQAGETDPGRENSE
jgi:hypothetical protein